jgi:hypothetical protein
MISLKEAATGYETISPMHYDHVVAIANFKEFIDAEFGLLVLQLQFIYFLHQNIQLNFCVYQRMTIGILV